MHADMTARRADVPAGTEPQASILVVDDDPTMLELASVFLRQEGHFVSTAPDGSAAWDVLVSQSYDLAIVDLQMPRTNGFELIKLMRDHPAHRDTPVIVITSLSDTASIERAFAAGATTFVTKPVNWPLFSHEVHYVLRASAAEDGLRRARDEAQAINNRKDGLLSIMSHELRTPLNAIIGFAEVLQAHPEGPLGAKSYEDYVAEILGGGRRLLATLNDMFLYSSVLSKDTELREGDYPLSSLASEFDGAMHDRAREHGVRLKLSGFDEAVGLRCDLHLLGRALANLVDNAIKFSPSDGTVSVEANISMDGKLVISVRDEGPGMSEEDIARYLAPFMQSDMSLCRSVEGLGLGLTIAGTLVRLHGAELLFDVRAQGGTIARVLLPQSRLQHKHHPEFASSPARRA